MIIKAHVPTQQYGFIEIEGAPEEKAEIERLYNEYAETPISFRKGNRKLVKAWAGGDIWYDEDNHVYTNEAGEAYLSGSTYAGQLDTPFDTNLMAGKVAYKYGIPANDIIAMWEMKRDISNGFGTAVHAALELYGKYHKYAEKLEDKSYHLHDHPIIKNLVESFYKGRDSEKAHYEPLIVDHKRKYAGQIDRLVEEKDGYYIEDFKTNGEMKPAKLKNYWRQLSFYASILEALGFHVKGLRIHHWNEGKWQLIEHPVEEVK